MGRLQSRIRPEIPDCLTSVGIARSGENEGEKKPLEHTGLASRHADRECLARAGHGDQLGHRCDRPDQANRDHDGDTDPYAHLHLLCVATLSLAK
jgi:hypothetical protein